MFAGSSEGLDLPVQELYWVLNMLFEDFACFVSSAIPSHLQLTHQNLIFVFRLVGVKENEGFAFDVVAISFRIHFHEEFKCGLVFENWICVFVNFVYVFLAEGHVEPSLSAFKVSISGEFSWWFSADYAAFLVEPCRFPLPHGRRG